ncbi:hypothetical protein DSLASN_03880 [Desulfoluna limicola]|uniref:Uncharacterized protein n=1 Tax=Desulfoluna limicola TaxID=2810562 RepID=A0ABM7PC79_9BACT|nr:hypothetical protein DSLASN_03880 [Desulfoluna limicola]
MVLMSNDRIGALEGNRDGGMCVNPWGTSFHMKTRSASGVFTNLMVSSFGASVETEAI